MKRLLLLWVKGPLNCRLHGRSVQQISSNLLSLKNCVPSDFARQPWLLSEIDRWKVTEFRQFLLYTGSIVILDVVHPNVYENFMLLFVGLHILLTNTLSNIYSQYAHDVLVVLSITFVKFMEKKMQFTMCMDSLTSLKMLKSTAVLTIFLPFLLRTFFVN